MKNNVEFFGSADSSDEDLAREVAKRAGLSLPDICIPAVAANARLLQRHAAILLEGQHG